MARSAYLDMEAAGKNLLEQRGGQERTCLSKEADIRGKKTEARRRSYGLRDWVFTSNVFRMSGEILSETRIQKQNERECFFVRFSFRLTICVVRFAFRFVYLGTRQCRFVYRFPFSLYFIVYHFV